MKKIVLLLVLLALPLASQAQQNRVSDKELVSVLWAMGQMYPDGFTLSLDSLRQPTQGLAVSYLATQNSFDKKSLPAVIKHAHAHNNVVGGWYDPVEDKYYFDSTIIFPEDSLTAALAFARENQQHTVYDLGRKINIRSNYEQQDIYDTDMGSSTDDLFALMMLYRYMDMKRCKLIGVVVDRMGKANADIVDVLNNYYGYPDIPIGLETQGAPDPKVWITYHNLPYARTTDAVPMFKRTVGDNGTYMEGYKLYRKLLAAQPDKSVTIASVGFVTCLARLMESGPDEYSPLGGLDLLQKKVKAIYLMGGVFGKSDQHDYNFTAAIDYSLRFFRDLPRDIDIVFSPGEVGDPLYYSAETIISDMDWTDAHPIKWIYEFLNEDKFQKMWDPLAVIQAVEGDELFNLSERGWVELTPTGETNFTPDPKGNARYQLPGDARWSKAMLNYIRLMSIQH